MSNPQKQSSSNQENPPAVVGNKIPTTDNTKRKWNYFRTYADNRKTKNLHNIIPNIPNSNLVQETAAQQSCVPEVNNIWAPLKTIKTVDTRDKGGNPYPKLELDRSNLKAVEGASSNIQPNLVKSKELIMKKAKLNPKPAQQNEAAKPALAGLPTPGVGKANPPIQQQSAAQPSPQGRMTASSFMNVNQQPHIKPLMSTPIHLPGIPRSFLIKQQMRLQREPGTPMYGIPQIASSQGPMWEPTAEPVTNPWTQTQIGQTFDQRGQTFDQSGQAYDSKGQNTEQSGQHFDQGGQYGQGTSQSQEQIFNKVEKCVEPLKQPYSPSDTYEDTGINEGTEEDDQDEMADGQQTGSKRLSAFKRLGPLTKPKKPKLTINLLLNKEQPVREVVDQSEDLDYNKYTPVHLKPDVQTSLDDTVMKYLVFWPWKKNVPIRRTHNTRHSKSVMMLELEQMQDVYGKDSLFFLISVTGYPGSWSKEDVLDTVLESVEGKSLIPCFIEFSRTECKFLVIRSQAALIAIHKYAFVIRKNGVELHLMIGMISLTLNQIDYIPRLVLRKRLLFAMQGETELNLKEFTTKSDVSHFIYFPLNRVTNQAELVQLQSSVSWEFLTKLVLSHNRITTLSGFDLRKTTPRLKHLDLSYNRIEGVTALLKCRDLPLNSIVLEGNPICTDYTEQERYIKVLRMIFSELKEIDGVPLRVGESFPETKRNYCPPDAKRVAERLLEVLFPLMDAAPDERILCEDLYDADAVVTVTFMYKLRYSPIYKNYHSLFAHARVMDEGDMGSIEGASEIAKIYSRWPTLKHDPLTFTVDVMYHSDSTTILRVAGILKLTAKTLAEDEHLLSFTRTIVLHSVDTVEYKITNEMIYWDLPDKDRAREAFQKTSIKSKNVSLKLESPPDEELKENLLKIFMKLTEMERKPSEKCLEVKNWHLKHALEHFSNLLKLDNLQPLYI